MTQHEITKAAPLLDASGNLTEPGWARSLLPVYCRSQIRAPKTRIKEWDYYCITDGHIGLALTIADNGYMGLDSISFLNFDERWEITKSPMRLFPMGKTHLPESSRLGASEIAASGYALAFYHEDGARQLSFHMDNFRGKDAIEGIITLTDEPVESIVIATPFDKPGHFYYNQKINCLRASGWVELGGEKFELTPDRFFAVLDWGRGVWTYHNTWYWSSASGELDGVPFGWNLGYGFGDTSAATENALFYNGTLHKLEHINFEIPFKDGREDFLAPWRFTSSDGRFEMQFQPVLDRAACTDLKLLKSDSTRSSESSPEQPFWTTKACFRCAISSDLRKKWKTSGSAELCIAPSDAAVEHYMLCSTAAFRFLSTRFCLKTSFCS